MTNRKHTGPYLFIGIAVVLVVLGGLIIGNLQSKPSSTKSADTNTINIKNYMFDPETTTVAVGTKVTWTNLDAVNHTITADTSSDSVPSSMDIAQGSSYSFTFSKAGTYTYHCFPHPYMHGKIIVK